MINLLPGKGFLPSGSSLPRGGLPPPESSARAALRLLTEYYLWRDAVGLDPGPVERGRLRRMAQDAVRVGVVFSDWAALPE